MPSSSTYLPPPPGPPGMYFRFLGGGAESDMVRLLSGRPELLTRGLGVPGSGAIGRMWVQPKVDEGRALLDSGRGVQRVEAGVLRGGAVQRNSSAFVGRAAGASAGVWKRVCDGDSTVSPAEVGGARSGWGCARPGRD
ncbi:hypothetical protein PMIN01_06866 [Paraphaeosphaeria minitans]|uniref:Uncharacterized protein n=1 Tax=Paraphaeosphaeria minitans TaxID=565426 RepID=A0A9P6KR41_9PLEO|nr:hypothetical protein PMIN01_06866 [Paraphaeosphaeria minitans]